MLFLQRCYLQFYADGYGGHSLFDPFSLGHDFRLDVHPGTQIQVRGL